METRLRELDDGDMGRIVPMAADHYNYHRALTGAPAEFWETEESAAKAVAGWRASGAVYVIEREEIVGFMAIRRGGHNAAWLEELYVAPGCRGGGIGKDAMELLDTILREEGLTALFVDVIPRNERALDFYRSCGFDHLNMLQLRKNYDSRLDKQDVVDILGRTFKKY
jgi:ribosomal protein S18 acetylase RimI-like enzyme